MRKIEILKLSATGEFWRLGLTVELNGVKTSSRVTVLQVFYPYLTHPQHRNTIQMQLLFARE